MFIREDNSCLNCKHCTEREWWQLATISREDGRPAPALTLSERRYFLALMKREVGWGVVAIEQHML